MRYWVLHVVTRVFFLKKIHDVTLRFIQLNLRDLFLLKYVWERSFSSLILAGCTLKLTQLFPLLVFPIFSQSINPNFFHFFFPNYIFHQKTNLSFSNCPTTNWNSSAGNELFSNFFFKFDPEWIEIQQSKLTTNKSKFNQQHCRKVLAKESKLA